MINTIIKDPSSGVGASVTEDKSLLMTMQTFPPDEIQKIRPFRQLFTDDGLPTGSSDFKVTASSLAPIDFWIPASNENDRFITRITWMISGASPTLYQIGTATRLKSDCVLFYTHSGGEVVTLSPTPLRSNFDFVFMCGEASNGVLMEKAISATVSAYMPTMYLDRYVPPFGVKLERNSLQRLTFRITDDTDLVGINSFSATAFGFERTP